MAKNVHFWGAVFWTNIWAQIHVHLLSVGTFSCPESGPEYGPCVGSDPELPMWGRFPAPPTVGGHHLVPRIRARIWTQFWVRHLGGSWAVLVAISACSSLAVGLQIVVSLERVAQKVGFHCSQAACRFVGIGQCGALDAVTVCDGIALSAHPVCCRISCTSCVLSSIRVRPSLLRACQPRYTSRWEAPAS